MLGQSGQRRVPAGSSAPVRAASRDRESQTVAMSPVICSPRGPVHSATRLHEFPTPDEVSGQ